jgi:hypothetical protein
MIRLTLCAALVAAAFSVQAQTTGSAVQRDVNQQQRIENGLQNGSLTTREAGKLEHEEANIDRMQSKALKDGTLSPQEKARIQRAQNQASRDIARAEHNGVKGNPQSASSQRMQADVQRNINQQKRIEAGVQNGSLTNHEVGKLEHGQARVDRIEANAARNGHVGAAEQRRIQNNENAQSRRIHHEKTDAQRQPS